MPIISAAMLFFFAAMTDLADGYVAKRFNAITPLGAVLDPIADKLLMDSLFLTLAFDAHLPAWIALLVIGRDLLMVAGTLALRLLAGRFRVQPLLVGKLSTFFQIVLGGAVLARLSFFPALDPGRPTAGHDLDLRGRLGHCLRACGRAHLDARSRRPLTPPCRRCPSSHLRRPPLPRQLLLDLPHAVGEGLADFLPSPSNREALDAVLRWPPGRARLPPGRTAGSGKTHLARIWAERAGAVFLRGHELWEPAEPLRRLGDAAACVVDDAEDMADETLLFHLYNRLAERRGWLLLTASRPVAAWPLRLPDLRSRLLTAWPVRIGPPDDGLLAALLVKQLADRQLRPDAGVVAFWSTGSSGRSCRPGCGAGARPRIAAGAPPVDDAAGTAGARRARARDDMGGRSVMDLGIAGRRAIVCAASKGLGRACAEALAENGVALVVNARGSEALEATAEAIRSRHRVPVTAVAADITTPEGRAAVLAAARSPTSW